MSPLRTTVLTAALALPAVLAGSLLPAALPAASAVPPPASSGASPSPAPLVRVTDADDGRAVSLVPGQQLRVELARADATWRGLERSTPLLQVLGYAADGNGLAVGLLALAPGGPQLLTATSGERTWTLRVDVTDGTAGAPRTCAPPTSSPGPTASAVPSATGTPAPPDGRAFGPGDDGTRPTVRVGDPLNVTLDDCDRPYGPVTADGPLRRDSASSSLLDGQAEADLVPTAPGTATLTAERDAPCAARAAASCPPPWRVVVEVEAEVCDVTLGGPALVPVGSTVALAGRARPFETVEVLFRRRGAAEHAVRRSLRAGPDGAFSTSYAGLDDHRWFARTSRCASAPGLTQVLPTVTGPEQVRAGTPARLVVRAAAGSRVEVLFRRAMTASFVPRRAGTAGADGRFLAEFRPDVDHAYLVASLGRTSEASVTRAR